MDGLTELGDLSGNLFSRCGEFFRLDAVAGLGAGVELGSNGL